MWEDLSTHRRAATVNLSKSSHGFNSTSWHALTQYWDLLHPDSAEGHHKTSIIRSRKPDPVLSSCVTRIELRALGKIPEGEELTVSYVDSLKVSTDRQRKLKEHFYFDCTCEHCRQHIKDDLMMAAAADSEGKKVSEGRTRAGFCCTPVWFSSHTKYGICSMSSFHYNPVYSCCFVVVSPSQPSADKVKEVTAFSKECLEKIERSRIEKDYHEVHNTAFSFSSFPSLLLSSTVSASPLSFPPAFCLSSLRSSSCVMSVWRNRRTSWPTLTCISCVCSA